MFIQSGNEE